MNGNYQEKFVVDPQTGELNLRAPLIPNPESQDHGLPVITLTVRAHDQGVPVRSNTVKVQVHNQVCKTQMTVNVLVNVNPKLEFSVSAEKLI